jgi:hypothetical protein
MAKLLCLNILAFHAIVLCKFEPHVRNMDNFLYQSAQMIISTPICPLDVLYVLNILPAIYLHWYLTIHKKVNSLTIKFTILHFIL